MALQYGDRIQESTATTGTDAYTLAGPVTGYRPFSDVCSDGDTCYYGVTDGTNWEIGLGTYSAGPHTLARTQIIASSNFGSPVSWGAGNKNIWNDVPAQFFQNGSRIREVATPGTITQLVTDSVIIVENNASSPVAVNLLPASQSSELTVKDGLGLCVNNPITLVCSGSDLIAGQASLVLNQFAGQFVKLTPIATGWSITG